MITSIQNPTSSVIKRDLLAIKTIDDKINITNVQVIKIFCNYNACKQENAQAKLCTRCKKAYYCNKTCQTQDWVSHKILCRPPVSVVIPHINEAAFDSTRLLMNHKRLRGYMMPVYSPTEKVSPQKGMAKLF